MAGRPEDDWIIAPRAAELLGVTLHTVYALIERGELEAEVTVPTDRPKRRRSTRLRRAAVDDYIERARVKPGELRHLHPNWTWERYG
jgi:excisionase family DNA binding protein